jgi:hypothetical protein
LSGFAHDPKDHNPITVRASAAYDYFGTYLYARSFLRTPDNVVQFAKVMAFCMTILAAMMAYEKATTFNIPWSLMTGTTANALSREGRVRPNGPFRHPILAGTVGASSLVVLAFLGRRKKWEMVKIAGVCGLIVFFSASSGPIVTAMMGIGALALWRWRTSVKSIRTAAICAMIGLHMVMNAPVWYLIARMDLAGGSTGWHRAELITKAIEHFDRWWLVGTDYTRDWMAYGILWSNDMVDITNLYIQMGVRGGLLLMLLFIGILLVSFRRLGRRMTSMRKAGDTNEFMLWCFGSALFAHAVTFLTVTYYDQSSIYFCLLIGAVPALCFVPKTAKLPPANGAFDAGTIDQMLAQKRAAAAKAVDTTATRA